MNGWVKLDRGILHDGVIFKDSDHLAVYVYILLNACYEKNGTVSYDTGKAIELKQGEVLVSVREIAKNCKIEATKVHRILKKLEACNKIATRSATGKTIVAIGFIEACETGNAQELQETRNTDTERKGEKRKEAKEKSSKERFSKSIKNSKKKNVYGTFENVKLTDEEYESFKSKFPVNYERYIDDLSHYIASRGDKYKSHYATLLTWNRDKSDEMSSFDTDEFFEAAVKRSAERIRQRASEETEKKPDTFPDLGW